MQTTNRNIMCIAPKNTNTNLVKSKKDKMSNLLQLPLNFTPRSTDILCGRGNVFSNHEGNRFFGRIVRSNLKQYRDAGSRPEKIRVVDDILQEFRSSGVRFAKLDSETKRWFELNDVLAHQKIGHAIRDTIRLLKDKTKNSKTITKTKQSKIAKRKRQPDALKLQNHVVPSSDTRQKTIEGILRMSVQTSAFLNDVWGDIENIPPQSQQKAETFSTEIVHPVTPPKPTKHTMDYNLFRSTKFSLKDEYPEESFEFSPGSFFGDFANYNARTTRVTSQ